MTSNHIKIPFTIKVSYFMDTTRRVSDIISHKQDPFEMISLFADCLSAQMFYFENMEENLRMKYFVNKSIHCHRLLEHVLRQNYTEDLKSYGKSKAKYNFEEARNEIKTRDSRTRTALDTNQTVDPSSSTNIILM